jgi:hypothetical protein
MATQLREFLSIGIEAPLRYGAGDPEVLDGNPGDSRSRSAWSRPTPRRKRPRSG